QTSRVSVRHSSQPVARVVDEVVEHLYDRRRPPLDHKIPACHGRLDVALLDETPVDCESELRHIAYTERACFLGAIDELVRSKDPELVAERRETRLEHLDGAGHGGIAATS